MLDIFSPWLFTFIFESGSFTENERHQFACAEWPMGFRSKPVSWSLIPKAEIISRDHNTWNFMCLLGIWAQFIVFACKHFTNRAKLPSCGYLDFFDCLALKEYHYDRHSSLPGHRTEQIDFKNILGSKITKALMSKPACWWNGTDIYLFLNQRKGSCQSTWQNRASETSTDLKI